MSYDVALHAVGLTDALSRLGYRIGPDTAGLAILRVPTPRLDVFGMWMPRVDREVR